ncbi:MAG: hypothetical protein KKA73_21970 [Chloroflexi bacterium]|nr:hypothetical protein [Chloroflexota bacterium]
MPILTLVQIYEAQAGVRRWDAGLGHTVQHSIAHLDWDASWLYDMTRNGTRIRWRVRPDRGNGPTSRHNLGYLSLAIDGQGWWLHGYQNHGGAWERSFPIAPGPVIDWPTSWAMFWLAEYTWILSVVRYLTMQAACWAGQRQVLQGLAQAPGDLVAELEASWNQLLDQRTPAGEARFWQLAFTLAPAAEAIRAAIWPALGLEDLSHPPRARLGQRPLQLALPLAA